MQLLACRKELENAPTDVIAIMRNPELPSCHASHLVGGLVNAHTKIVPRDILEKMQPTLNSLGRDYANSYRSHSLGRCLLLLAEVLLYALSPLTQCLMIQGCCSTSCNGILFSGSRTSNCNPVSDSIFDSRILS